MKKRLINTLCNDDVTHSEHELRYQFLSISHTYINNRKPRKYRLTAITTTSCSFVTVTEDSILVLGDVILAAITNKRLSRMIVGRPQKKIFRDKNLPVRITAFPFSKELEFP